MPKVTTQELDPTLLASMQLHKWTADGGNQHSIVGQDLNALTASGIYYGNNLANSPNGTTAFFRVWVAGSGGTTGLQLAFNAANKMWIRNMTGGVWTSWMEIINSELTTEALTLSGGATSGGRTPTIKKVGRHVQLVGTVSGAVVGTTFATLPAAYRPSEAQIFACGGFGGASAGRLAILTVGGSGTVSPLYIEASTTAIDLSSIHFIV